MLITYASQQRIGGGTPDWVPAGALFAFVVGEEDPLVWLDGAIVEDVSTVLTPTGGTVLISDGYWNPTDDPGGLDFIGDLLALIQNMTGADGFAIQLGIEIFDENIVMTCGLTIGEIDANNGLVSLSCAGGMALFSAGDEAGESAQFFMPLTGPIAIGMAASFNADIFQVGVATAIFDGDSIGGTLGDDPIFDTSEAKMDIPGSSVVPPCRVYRIVIFPPASPADDYEALRALAAE